MQGKKIDLLVNCRWLIPVVPHNQVLENCAIAIDQGRIIGIYPQGEATKQFTPDKLEQLHDHVVLPGLINAHGHSAMSLLRGFADDLPLRPWLEEHIWPAEGRYLGDSFVTEGTMLAMAEMITSGTTCFADMYFYHDAIAEALIQAGSDVDKATNDGATALMAASQEGHDAIAEALIQAGADVDKAMNDGDTALMLAIGAEHNAVVKVLKKAGAKR